MILIGACLGGGAAAGVLPKDSAETYELSFWESIKDSRHAGDYEAYLQAYPKGRFAGLARARIDRLKSPAPAAGGSGEGGRSAAPATSGSSAASGAAGAGSAPQAPPAATGKSSQRRTRQAAKQPDYTPGMGALPP